MMVYVMFLREDGHYQKRGEIADIPYHKYPRYDEPFIVCKIDGSVITKEMLTDDKVMLKLDKLQNPNTTKKVTDEEGNTHTVEAYDYFDAEGRSCEKDCPVITLDDVIFGGLDEQ